MEINRILFFLPDLLVGRIYLYRLRDRILGETRISHGNDLVSGHAY